MRNRRALLLLNAQLGAGLSSVRVVGGRIAALGVGPTGRDRVIDLQGDRVLPGLINAHDHLHLNSFPRQKYRNRYENVRDWIADIEKRRRSDPSLGVPDATREKRLLLGGLKNLLSGVTTVAHHDPLYPPLRRKIFPTRILDRYGWAHSLQIAGEQAVRRSYRSTAPGKPWIVHASEGVDAEAHSEFERLVALGCMSANTLLVHGVALDAGQRDRLIAAGAGLIWCPTSNLHLFGRTAVVADLIACGRVALGSDSRMSGGHDLLQELAAARAVAQLDEPTLESLVTSAAASLLRLRDRGVLRAGAAADLVVLPQHTPLSLTNRADIRLVMIDGRMRYADLDLARAFADADPSTPITVDGSRRMLDARVAAYLSRAGIDEHDIEPAEPAWRAA